MNFRVRVCAAATEVFLEMGTSPTPPRPMVHVSSMYSSHALDPKP